MVWCLILFNFITLQGDLESPPDKTLWFDIIYKEKTIGSLIATKSTKDAKINYHTSSTIKFRIIKEIAVNYKYDVSFNAKVLKKAAVNISINEKSHAKTLTHWHGNEYQITKNDKPEVAIKNTITYATVLLYFVEPLDITDCYSEQDGSFNTIISLGNHGYKKINANGKENEYYYKNGVLEKAVIDGGLIAFEMVRRE
ncbi:hypothetical protein Celal_3215 [Cellulophaga algicola DSM 14237]|uniref:Uncharacterized protein n=1 Tax=Cellulophaga algicola (strain DSM 14237 / IC166 / ACAM 630) TaxID=688270 RepID=E6X4Z4_CELAD|nr:DUF6134 family protein [Cellulophaga algicola]ADV50486.1 hypothetical protein Celal_3215 [Cellulophaga algicola DSM 14237]